MSIYPLMVPLATLCHSCFVIFGSAIGPLFFFSLRLFGAEHVCAMSVVAILCLSSWFSAIALNEFC